MILVTKKYLVPTLFLSFSALIFIALSADRDSLSLKTFKSETGWGYSIMAKGKEIIRQPYIPAIGGKRPFASRADARKAGKIVTDKINRGIEPFITTDELQNAGIVISR